MTTPSGELLHRLAGGVHPAGDAAPPAHADRSALNFSAMLDRARSGGLRTGLPVRLPLGLAPGMAESDRVALAAGTDMAQAEGIRRALIEVGGRTFRVDVTAREVIDAPHAHLRAVGGIDGAVLGAGDPEKPAWSGEVAGPARVVRNASLLDALADVRPDAG